MVEVKSKRMLVILAHPDDESFTAGGTLAKYAQQGVQIVLLYATRGEACIPGKIREPERREAAVNLGIEVYFLGYQDGQLADMLSHPLLEAISCWMDLVQPQVILTFDPVGVSGHSDHVTISTIVTQAYDLSYKKGLLLYFHPSETTVLGYGVTDSGTNTGAPLVRIDVSDYKQQKVRAIQSHVSQNPGLPGRPEEEMEKIPCHEIYTVARDAKTAENYPGWFEPQREDAAIAILEQ